MYQILSVTHTTSGEMIDDKAVLDFWYLACCGKCMVFEVDDIQKDFYRSSDIQISEGRFTLDDLNA